MCHRCTLDALNGIVVASSIKYLRLARNFPHTPKKLRVETKIDQEKAGLAVLCLCQYPKGLIT